MNKLKLYSGFLMMLLIFFSCSGDGGNASNDIIVGKWRAIEKYESNQIVALPTCLPHIYTEFKADNSVTGDKIISNDFPDECNLVQFDLGVVWENLGNSIYRIGYINEQGNLTKIYKDGLNLVMEDPDGTTKLIYEPY
jgi:hypothetical protein